MKSLKTIAAEAATLTAEKNKAYNSSLSNIGKVVEMMYPEGIPREAYLDLTIMVRVLDKLFRVSGERNAFGENPWKDILGYALLATQLTSDMQKQ